MDIVSLLTTSIPAYFVLGPLVVVLIILITLVTKSGSPQVVAPLSVAQPVPTTIPQPEVAPTMTAPIVTTPIAEPVVTEAPLAQSAPAPSVAPANIPPISSWKPAAPTPIVEEAPVEVAPVEQPAAAEIAAVNPVESVPGMAEQSVAPSEVLPESRPTTVS